MNTFDDCDINVSLLDDKDRHIDSRFVASNTVIKLTFCNVEYLFLTLLLLRYSIVFSRL